MVDSSSELEDPPDVLPEDVPPEVPDEVPPEVPEDVPPLVSLEELPPVFPEEPVPELPLSEEPPDVDPEDPDPEDAAARTEKLAVSRSSSVVQSSAHRKYVPAGTVDAQVRVIPVVL